MKTAQIGLIGLGVMGANIARNIANNNFPIVVFNRTTSTMTKFIKEHGNNNLFGEKKIEEFVKKITRPRKIMILVKAGPAVDKVIDTLLPLLDPEDIIIDCGNSNFHDTQRRFHQLKEQNIHFMGCGVSGGEEGALKGPSLMPGGTQESWEAVKHILEPISARDFNDGPCVSYIGSDAAGHYVKMVHNGIEYGVMQLMADAYESLRSVYKLDANEISDIFARFQNGKLNSYLFDISINVLRQKDEFMAGNLIDFIQDKAGNKGTGKWTSIDALERGVPLPIITSAVYARYSSAIKEKRKEISQFYREPSYQKLIPLEKFIPKLEGALYAGMLCAYAEGYALIQSAAQEENWEINLSEVARIWQGGCIIRAKILSLIHKSYQNSEQNTHLFEVPQIISELKGATDDLREITGFLVNQGVHIYSLSAAASYFEGISRENSSANFIQGLRDYFGAHTYERKDREGTFHTNWNS